ncbi:universal stress protein [Streptomyces sp. MUM 203J]|uniref:universal stress protein n=1 Tax=Streptomyces sp. MUM 203J TaxID=2791990 RepID=UPI001F04BC59|nr:universal stress protein [Streptomyces sp. MUM 203J]MCH0540350.1 universal stress protein [Streptomyces sp. MUM 203J]
MSERIAVGVDGSEEALAAVDWGADEAALRDAELRLVFASRWEKHPNAVQPSAGDQQELARRLLGEAEDRVRARHPGLAMASETVEDAPAAALLDAAAEALLLVVGSQGLGAGGGFWTGSVAQAAVAEARGPVVLVRPAGAAAGDGQGQGQEIVLGLDVRHPHEELLAFAFDSAVRRGAPLRIVHAWHFPAGIMHQSAEDGRDTGPQAERSAELAATVRPWRGRFPGVEVTEQVVAGRAGEHLTRAVSPATGLLVVGKRARRASVGPHIGSVTHAAIHHAACPVAVVPHS